MTEEAAASASEKLQQKKNEEMKSLIQRIFIGVKDDKTWREGAKRSIREPLDFILGVAIRSDPLYRGEMGSFSRSYMASGTFTDSNFDVHLPLNLPSEDVLKFSSMISEYESKSLPIVQLQTANEELKSASSNNPWSAVLDNSGYVSAKKLRANLHAQLERSVKAWNERGRNNQAEIKLCPMELNVPLRMEFQMEGLDGGGKTVSADFTPVILGGKSVTELTEAKRIIWEDVSQETWPRDPRRRETLLNQLIILPYKDISKFTISFMLMHKAMVKMFDDQGQTTRLMLYRVFKIINKKIWNTGSDEEGIKIGLNCLLNVFLDEVNKHQYPKDWSDEAINTRFRSILTDCKTKLSSAEYQQYLLPNAGRFNPLSTYKQGNGAFLSPKLGGIVRRMEQMIKDPVKALENLLEAESGRRSP